MLLIRNVFRISLCSSQVQTLQIPCTPGFSFAVFLSKPTTVRDWNIQGLPTDSFSTENGVIVNRGNRFVAVPVVTFRFKRVFKYTFLVFSLCQDGH